MAIVVLDNDECTGSWAGLSVLYSLMANPSTILFASLMESTKCCRPGLRTLYNHLLKHKQSGRISKIYMCTAASNDTGWVTFLREALEIWYGKPVYDGVVHGGMILQWHRLHGTPPVDHATGSYIKNMDMIRTLSDSPLRTPVIAVDDRPLYIQKGASIGVIPYYANLDLPRLCATHVHCGHFPGMQLAVTGVAGRIKQGPQIDPLILENEMCMVLARIFLLTAKEAGPRLPLHPAAQVAVPSETG